MKAALNDGGRLYQCADCEDQDRPHEEVRYDGMPTLCLRCGSVGSFVDTGAVAIERVADTAGRGRP